MGRKLINSKKIRYEGIEFDSNLELTMYKLLQTANIPFKYQGETFVLFEAMVYPEEVWERTRKDSPGMSDKRKSLPIRYTPDFVGDGFIIETKGRPNESFPLRWKMFKKTMSLSPKPPLLFMPTKKSDCEQVIEILKSKGYGRGTK